ncbi:MAG: amino acid ABC transporter permease [Beijerinckiaceae bacterium]
MSDSFIRTASTPRRPAPADSIGALGWMREHMFATPVSSMLTLLSLLLLAWIVPDLVRFALIDAIWSAPDGEACRAPGAGACWAFVGAKFDFFVYGLYPRDEVWRVNLVLALGALLVVWMLWPGAPGRSVAAGLFFTLFPVVSFGLLTGKPPFPLHWLPGTAGLWAFAAATAIGAGLAWNFRMHALAYVCAGLLVWLLTGLLWRELGLRPVGTHLWGGVFVSLLVAAIGIVFSLPLGVLLALGRRSEMPMVRFCSVVFIEFIRGVPLITILFMANFMLPLFVPQEWSPDRLLRPLIGVALFASAYMAEVVRGGLQAIPKGQFEGAMAVGLNWQQSMRLIVLPQALVLVIPGIVNSFIALFKDTTLVAIAGVFDFLKAIETQRDDPAWAGPTISATGYLFAALFYFVFCFGMSRYSMMMEKRLSAGRKH